MDDDQIEEIYALARLAFQGGQRSFQVQAYPFRMTPQNLAANRDSRHLEFWRMLKEGNDHFVVTGQPPKKNHRAVINDHLGQAKLFFGAVV